MAEREWNLAYPFRAVGVALVINHAHVDADAGLEQSLRVIAHAPLSAANIKRKHMLSL